MSLAPRNVVILGGGISGLTAAWALVRSAANRTWRGEGELKGESFLCFLFCLAPDLRCTTKNGHPLNSIWHPLIPPARLGFTLTTCTHRCSSAENNSRGCGLHFGRLYKCKKNEEAFPYTRTTERQRESARARRPSFPPADLSTPM